MPTNRSYLAQCNWLFSTTAPPAPSGVRVVRSNDNTQMTVSWTPSTVVQARSLIQFYRVTYTPTAVGRKRQSGILCNQSPCDVPGTESSVMIIGLDPAINYGVQVAIVNGGGQPGENTAPLTVEPVTTVPPTEDEGEHVICSIFLRRKAFGTVTPKMWCVCVYIYILRVPFR